MGTFARLALLFLQTYGILFALIGAHKLRRRLGLDLYFILVGGLVVYMWWSTRLGMDILKIGEVRLPVASVAYFSSIFSALLLVYISDGVRMARRLILSILALQGLFLLLEVFTRLYVQVSPAMPYDISEAFLTPDWKMMASSSIALMADMVILVMLFQFLQNHFPSRSPTFKLFIALAVALSLDSLILVTGTQTDDTSFWLNLLCQGMGKIVMATLIAPPLAWYIRKETGGKVEDRSTFDIFRSAEQLTRSLHHTRTKYESLLNQMADAVFVMDPKGFLVEANPRFYDLTGFRPVDLNRLHYTSLIHPDSRPELVSVISVGMEGGEIPRRRRVTGMTKSGLALNVEIALCLLTEENTRTGMQVILHEVSG